MLIFGVGGVGGIYGIIKVSKDRKKELEEKIKAEVQLQRSVDALHHRVDELAKKDGVCTSHDTHTAKLMDIDMKIKELEEHRFKDVEFKGEIRGRLNSMEDKVSGLKDSVDKTNTALQETNSKIDRLLTALVKNGGKI